MVKTKVQEWDATAGNNTDIDGNNIAEGCSPGGINNAIREVMAHIKTALTGADDGIVTGTAGTTNNLAKWDANGDLIDGPAATGADVAYVSGTAGTNGNLVSWNADGDAVDSTYAPIDEDDMFSDSATKLPTQQSVKAYVDGKFTRATEIATTSGTSHSFALTGTVRRVVVMLDGVSLNGATDRLAIRLGTGGAATTTGYLSGAGEIGGATNDQTTFAALTRGAAVAANAWSGRIVFEHMGGNSWVWSGTIYASGQSVQVTTGAVTLAGALDYVALISSTATDSFDAGTVSIAYEVD